MADASRPGSNLNQILSNAHAPNLIQSRLGRVGCWGGWDTQPDWHIPPALGVRRHRVRLGNSVVSRLQTALASDGAKKMSASMSKRHDLTHLVITLSRFQRCRSCSKHASSSPPQHLHLFEMWLDKESSTAQRCTDAWRVFFRVPDLRMWHLDPSPCQLQQHLG